MTKRRSFAAFAALLLIACFAATAFATDNNNNQAGGFWPASTEPADAHSYVFDMAGLFSASEAEDLEARAAEISQRYNLGVYIVTMDDYRNYTSSRSVERAAVEFFDSNSLGMGSDNAGAMFLLSMAERDYDLDFNGSRADYAFTEAGRDRLEDRVLSYFRRNDYYGGYREYLDTCETYLAAAEQGTPVGQGERSSADRGKLSPVLGLIPGIIAAIITGIALVAPMHSAGMKHDANDYVVQGSLHLRRHSDMFLHRSVTRQPRQTQSSSGSGSSHHYSSGSHSGRSGKF